MVRPILFVVVSFFFACHGYGQESTYSEVENQWFLDIRKGFTPASMSVSELSSSVAELTDLLTTYPQTVNRKAALLMLFQAQSRLGLDCTELHRLADLVEAESPIHQDYFEMARSFYSNDCGPEKAASTLLKAIDLMKGATPVTGTWYYTLLGDIRVMQKDYSAAVNAYSVAYSRMDSVFAEEERTGVYLRSAGAFDGRKEEERSVGLRLASSMLKTEQAAAATVLLEDLLLEHPTNSDVIALYNRSLEAQKLSLNDQQERKEALFAAITERLEETKTESKVGPQSFSLVLPDLSGKLISVSDFRGAVVVVSFWAGWCAPCFKEMPYLEELKASFGSDLEVLLVNVDEDFSISGAPPVTQPDSESSAGALASPESKGATLDRLTMMQRVATEYRIESKMLVGDKTTMEQHDVFVLPLTLIIDRNGVLRFRHIGFREDSGVKGILRTQIDGLLNE
jgi:thiol-disulfide isomerase/thioredoxin